MFSPSRFTLALLLHAIAIGSGCLVGGGVGYDAFGWLGLLLGGAAGLVAGALLGRIPDLLGTRWMLRSVARTPTDELRRQVAFRADWDFGKTLALLHLADRGEKVDSYLPEFLHQLGSPDVLRRVYAWDALRLVFPATAARYPSFDPWASTEACRRILHS